MNFRIVLKEDYLSNRDKILDDIRYLYLCDDYKYANIDEITRCLDIIFGVPNTLLVLLYEGDKLVCMVNGYEYNTMTHDWAVLALFTKKDYRGKGLGYKTLKFIVEEIRKYNPNKIVSGIEKDNISSIKLHESVGFINSGMMWNEIEDGFPDDHIGFIIK